MSIKTINEQYKKLFEGEVVSFADYKAKKQGNAEPVQKTTQQDADAFTVLAPNDLVITINKVKVLWSERDWFRDNQVLDFDDFQEKVYAYDRQVKSEGMGYDKVKYELDITVKSIDGTENTTYTGRVDLGDGPKYVNVISNVKDFLKDEYNVTITNKEIQAPEFVTAEPRKQEQQPKEQQDNSVYAKPVSNPKKDASEVAVGDVLCVTWGYSMTIVDFYRVISRTKSSVKLVKLKNKIVSGDGWQGTVKPLDEEVPDNKIDGKSFRIKSYGSGMVCKVNNHYAYYWDGSAEHFNSLD